MAKSSAERCLWNAPLLFVRVINYNWLLTLFFCTGLGYVIAITFSRSSRITRLLAVIFFEFDYRERDKRANLDNALFIVETIYSNYWFVRRIRGLRCENLSLSARNSGTPAMRRTGEEFFCASPGVFGSLPIPLVNYLITNAADYATLGRDESSYIRSVTLPFVYKPHIHTLRCENSKLSELLHKTYPHTSDKLYEKFSCKWEKSWGKAGRFMQIETHSSSFVINYGRGVNI